MTSFVKFGNILLSCYQTNWKQVLHEHFPKPVDPEVVEPGQDCALAENFSRVIDLFLICTLNKKKTRDCQNDYMAPGGDHGIKKELLMSPFNHLHHLEEMLHIAQLLPTGNHPPLNVAPQVDWFYISFHCLDQAEYVHSKGKLSNKILRTFAEYFESIFLACLSNGLIQEMYDTALFCYQAQALPQA